MVSIDSMKRKGHKLKHKFHFTMRKNFFTLKVAEHWTAAQRRCGFSLSGDILNPPTKHDREVGLDDLQRSLPSLRML